MTKFRKGLSDKVRTKLKNKGKTTSVANPFEIKVNKVKHTVVNKKVEKWEKGLPGVSRSKAIKKRKDTILNELHQMKKSNTLHDKRIGEKDSNLTAEEKMVQRFALERKLQTSKQSTFNLNDEEVVLTHYGQSLAENLKDRPGSDSDDDDHFADRNSGKYQFGGFNNDENNSTWKDKMEEVIAESKKHKYERQMEKEKSYEATKELDGIWKSVVDKMVPQRKDPGARTMSNFMMLSRTLIMEQKSAGASDKFKTDDQRAKEEAERLKKLEAQRLDRMRGHEEKKKVMDHVSADSLTNTFALTKKGKMRVTFDGDSEDSDDGEEEEKEKKEGSDEEDDNDDNDSGEDEEDEGEESGSEDEDNFSDLEEDDDDNDDDESSDGEEDEDENSGSGDEVDVDTNTKSILKESTSKSKSTPLPVTKDPKTGKTEIPFVFEAPQSYEELQTLLGDHTTEDQLTIVSRLIKCHHSSLAEGNKDKLQQIHLFLLQYVGEIVEGENCDVKLFDGLARHLWELTQTFSLVTAKFFQTIVLEAQKQYAALLEKRGGRGIFPSMSTLVYLRLVEMLFPTSDFRHPVTTPSTHFIAQMLAESSVKSLKDVANGLFVCSLALQYVQSSKRFIPEVVTFLHGILYLASSESKAETSATIFPPFRKANRETCQMELKENCDKVSANVSLSQLINSADELDPTQARCDLVNISLDLLENCMAAWSEHPCMFHIMNPAYKQLDCLPTKFYPQVMKEKIEKLKSKIMETCKKPLTAMQHPSRKPEALVLFEPKLQENYTGKRKRGGTNRDVNSRQRLLHKYKREMKSAVREIKRDNAVLAQHKLDVTLKKDADRKRKVKDIMSSLANQEGDYNAIKRGKPMS